MDRKVPALAFCAFLFIAVAGCVNSPRDSDNDGLSAREVLEKSFSASYAARSYSYKMSMRASIPQAPGGVSMEVMSASGRVDKEKRKMHLSAVMNPLQASQNTETYIIRNTYYARLASGEWIKQEANGEELWERESIQGMQSELMNSSQISLLGQEKLDGADCYVLKITPEKGQLPQLLGRNAELDEGALENIVSASIQEWVERESFYMKKVLFSVDMENNGTIMRMETEIIFSDYGKDQGIVLPAEALNAKAPAAQTANRPTQEEVRRLEEGG